jgi:DNA-binding HxlR family transcriptional regulator
VEEPERASDPEATALADAVARVGDRWTLRLVHALLRGPQRFGDLERALGIAPNVLAQRLRALGEDGLLVAEAYERRPPRYRYALTQPGRELAGVLRLLAAWASDDHGPRHAACGTALEPRWWCSTCERPSDGTPDEDLIRL